ncbi:MAG TPA: hypothetical protein VIK86_08345 [Candidatus Paceibacterota bacterium]
MRTYIKKLQAKPEGTRKQIFFGSMVFCMALVSLVWLSGFGNKFSPENSVKAQEDVKPFSLFGKTISDTYNNITASVGNISLPKKQDVTNEVKNEKQVNLIPVELSPQTEFTGLEKQ